MKSKRVKKVLLEDLVIGKIYNDGFQRGILASKSSHSISFIKIDSNGGWGMTRVDHPAYFEYVDEFKFGR